MGDGVQSHLWLLVIHVDSFNSTLKVGEIGLSAYYSQYFLFLAFVLDFSYVFLFLYSALRGLCICIFNEFLLYGYP